MKFSTLVGAATALAASASAVSALTIPRSDNVARELGALSGGAWAEQLEARSDLEARIVWNPTITQPTADQSAVAGSRLLVEWDTSDAPKSFNTSAPVAIKLGYDDGGAGGLHEYWDLVKPEDKIPLSSGHAVTTLPASLETRSDYIVVVFGDSGNASPKFKIAAKSAKRIVYNPTVTTPKGGETFAAGSKTTVTWSLDDLPASLKNSHVEIRLGYAPSKGDEGYHEKWSLGQFPITDAKAEVTLPSDLEARDDYLFVLLGDSGNFSKEFKVTTA